MKAMLVMLRNVPHTERMDLVTDFLWVALVPSHTGDPELSLGLNKCVNVCIYDALQWTSMISGLFSPHTPCFWDKLQIHHYLDQDKVLTADK